jgi:hypothetical protein
MDLGWHFSETKLFVAKELLLHVIACIHRPNMHMTEYVEKKKWQGFKMLKNGLHQSAFWLSRSSLLHGRKRESERKGDEMLDPMLCFVVIHFLNLRGGINRVHYAPGSH